MTSSNGNSEREKRHITMRKMKKIMGQSTTPGTYFFSKKRGFKKLQSVTHFNKSRKRNLGKKKEVEIEWNQGPPNQRRGKH